PRGQNWGVPPPDGEAIRRNGYDFFLKNLEANCRYGGALRIDHVMQLNHLFWIANGCSPSQGVYVKEREDELLSVVALQSQQSRALVVGEDLGTLPHGFRERLMEKGIFSYRLFYFEQDDQGNYVPFQDYPRTALVSISTHDLPTLAGFWSYRDIELRREIGLISAPQAETQRSQRTNQKARIIERLFQDGFLTDQNAHAAWESPTPTDDLHTAVLNFVLRTPSLLALINQEDLFLDLRQQNFPGTTSEHPNWVTKMRYTVEELRSNAEACRMTEKFRRLVAASGRRSPCQDSGG
ncbi:MAG: 4-alpha-glucanotransferase, partial [Desulfomonilaceae bacterium]